MAGARPVKMHVTFAPTPAAWRCWQRCAWPRRAKDKGNPKRGNRLRAPGAQDGRPVRNEDAPPRLTEARAVRRLHRSARQSLCDRRCRPGRSVAKFVGWRKSSAGRDSGRRRGNASAGRRGAAIRSVTCVVRVGVYIAESRSHFLLADNAGIGEWRVICRAASTQRLM